MLFAFDIDGVLARDCQGQARARFVNRHLDLQIPEQRIATITTFQDIASFPELQSFGQCYADAEERIKQAYLCAFGDEQYLSELIPIPGSMEGVHWLLERADISYLSCRLPQHQGATRSWLRKHGYPMHQRAYTCGTYLNKWRGLVIMIQQVGQVLLFDDQIPELLDILPAFARDNPHLTMLLLDQLGLVSFATPLASINSVYRNQFPIEHLASWQDVAYMFAETL